MAHGNYRCRYNKLPLNLLFVGLVFVFVAVVAVVVVNVLVVVVVVCVCSLVVVVCAGGWDNGIRDWLAEGRITGWRDSRIAGCPAAAAAPAGAATGSSHVLSLISFIKKDNEPVAVSVSVSLTLYHTTCVCV